MRGKSSAAACLVNWVLKTLEYNDLYQKVLPLMKDGARPWEPVASAAVPVNEEETQAAIKVIVTKADVESLGCEPGLAQCITELKCLAHPPRDVQQVIQACAFLLKDCKKEF